MVNENTLATGTEEALNELGRSLLHSENEEPAKKVFETLIERYPGSTAGYMGLVEIAEMAGDAEEELRAWRRHNQKFPEHRDGQVKYGELLRKTEKFDEAEAHFQKLLEKWPGVKRVLAGLARTASSARQYELAVTRWEELTEDYPEEIHFRINLIRALIDILDFDRAQSMYDEHLTKQSNATYLLLQVDIHMAQFELEQALVAAQGCLSKHPDSGQILNKVIVLLIILGRTTGERKYAEQALTLLDHYAKNHPGTQPDFDKRIEVNILLGREEDALSLTSQLTHDLSQRNMELRAWAMYVNGRIDDAKSLWNEIANLHYHTRIRPPAPGTLKRVDENPMELARDSILLFTAVRNERWRLQWFLEYYRALGVERFFFVDNDSTDGTGQFLHEQPDVYVFWTDQSYAQAYSGMQWINWLIDEYGTDCWCIYADVDEALVFPDMENRSLRSLTNYMANHGQEAMYAFMLDMYAPHLRSQRRDNDYTGFLNDYPLFENQYSWANTSICPFLYTAGGIRRRFSLGENQTKTPLIRGGIGIKFLMSSHLITPAHLSDVSGVMLHYKLAGDFEESFRKELTNNTRIARCKTRHWRYIEALKELPHDASFIDANATPYQTSQQLVDLGFLNTSPEFTTGKYD